MIYMIFCIFVLTGVFLFVSAPGAADLSLYRTEEIKGGEGDLCMTPTYDTGCQEGLTCVIIEKSYYVNGYCLNESSTDEYVFLE